MNKKHFLITLFFISFLSINAQNHQEQAKKIENNESKQKIKVKNKTQLDAIGNFFVSGTSQGIIVGCYVILLPANKNKEQTIPEFYWLDKQAFGGFKKPGKQSKVKIVNVLKHGFANRLEITIPNIKTYNFTLEPKKYIIKIIYDKNRQINVTLKEHTRVQKKITTEVAKNTESKEEKSFLSEIKEAIDELK
jgi:hypothetical protein